MPEPDAPPSRFALPVGRQSFEALSPFLRRLAKLIGAITLLLAGGTVGFVVTENTSVWDGFVWSLDTIATIGSIPSPDSTSGEILKVALTVFGVGTLFYALVTVTEFFVAGHLGGLLEERRALRMIRSMSDHHLICGFGRVGRQVGRDLRRAGHAFVVIDINPHNRELADAMDAPFIEGSPSDDDVLREAGIEHVRSVIACVDSDAENIFVTLTARELRPDVMIVARASVEDSEKKLRRAGANRVISPYKASGAEMARLALHPQVPVAVSVAPEYRIEEIEVSPDCEGAGRRLEEVSGGTAIAAVRRAEGEIELQPSLETVVDPGDVVVAVGSDSAMDELENAFAPAGLRTKDEHPAL